MHIIFCVLSRVVLEHLLLMLDLLRETFFKRGRLEREKQTIGTQKITEICYTSLEVYICMVYTTRGMQSEIPVHLEQAMLT